MSYVFIDDGLTRRARIAGVQGVHGDLCFEYRPMLPRAVEEMEGRVTSMLNRGDFGAASDYVGKVIGEQVKAWDVRLRSGGEVSPSADAVRKLPPVLFNKLKMVVQGSRPTDYRSDWTQQEIEEYLATGGTTSLGDERKN